ncbi:centromere protein C-like isoform X2 [Glycine soja]|uniref:centromere protein C-like isoform X2 n=1 Tax=Glycine soja TaxID=3848 RepID=UPI00103FF0E2|nr:centromere protein C-like isoform X2 [Glycine soja]
MEKEGDALVDPLSNYWGLSLFPQPSFPPSKPYNSDQDLHTIHTHLRSMALRSPAKLVHQAKSIVDGNPQLFNSENSNHPTSQKTNDAEGEFRRNPRPGLGLKRPRFSMKPTKKPSVESLLPTLDLDSLKDPAEFFLAHERLENAKREIQKQLGGASFESDQDNVAARPRQRRPGLLGNNQLPIKYKHRYPKETSDDVLSSQETLGSQSLAPVTENTDKGEASMASSEKEVIDSSGTKGIELDELLDGLLHCDSEDLEGDGAITLLQERLQIKPIALEKFSVPDFPDEQMVDLKSLQGNKSKPRKALSDIDNLLKGMSMNMNKKTPLKKAVQCPVQQLASPTPPRSPFASLSLLQKHISQSKQSMDPFSAHEIDHLSSKNYSPTHMVNPELNLVRSANPSNELNAHMIEDAIAVGKASTVLDTDRNDTNSSEIPKEEKSGKSSNKLNAPSIQDIIAVGGTSLAEDTVRNGTSTSRKSMVDNSREPRFDVNILSNEPHGDMDVDVGGSGMGDNEDRSNIEAHTIEGDIAVSNTSTVLDTDINGTHTSEVSKEDNSGKSSNNLNVSLIEDIIAVYGTSLAEDTTRNCTSTFKKSMVDNSREPRFDVTLDSNEPHVNMDVDVGVSAVGDRVMDDTKDRSNIEVNASCQSEDKAENMQTFTASIPTDGMNLNVLNPLADQPNPAGYEANSVDKRARRSDDDPEHCLQEKTDGSMVPVNGQKRVKSLVQKVSKNKKLSNRHSLAAAGTSWTSGLRRSTRIRTRPLEYWKGERLVYGRVHKSLATVIGVKCISPGSDGKPIMKVKSYVSDKHKELFELASLY